MADTREGAWKCEGCGWTNRDREHECDGCGEPRWTAVQNHAQLSNALVKIRSAVGGALLITVSGETKMPREDWLAIEGALLAAGIQTPVVGVVAEADRG